MAKNINKEIEGLSITEARSRLTRLPEQLANMGWAVPLTRHGKPVMALMAWDLYEAIEETLEIMGDPDLMAALRMSIEDVAEGRVRSLAEVEADLGL